MNFTKPNGKRRVVITGGGMITALGRDWPAAFKQLQSGKNCIRYMKDWERFEKMNTRLACPYEGELPTYPRKKIRGMGRVALMAVTSADAAMKAADVSMCVFYAPPSETNFGGGLLAGTQSACDAACGAFADAVAEIAASPVER